MERNIKLVTQVKITEEECTSVLNGEISMGDLFQQYLKNTNVNRLRGNFVKDYIRHCTDFFENRIEETFLQLWEYDDIYYEFCVFLLTEHIPEFGVKVKGISAKDLSKKYHLHPLEAYVCLVNLRNHPAEALAKLYKIQLRKNKPK